MLNFKKRSRAKALRAKRKSNGRVSTATLTLAPVTDSAAVAMPDVSDTTAYRQPAEVSISNVSFAELLTAIRDGSAEKARDAALAMGTCGDPAAVDVLIEVVRNNDHYFHTMVRAAAVKSLGRIGDPHALDTLIGATRDTMAEVSDQAIQALAATHDQRAVEPLIRIVRNSDNFFLPAVRRTAIAALRILGGPDAAAELSAVAANSAEESSIRDAAAYAT